MNFPAETLRFLRALKRNNRREWFNENKQRYEDEVKTPIARFLDALRPRLAKLSTSFLVPDGPFRVYRDTRFSADKTPYKLNCAAQLPGGYISFSADGLFVGSGLYMPEAAQLQRFRAAVADDETGPELEAIVATLRKHAYEVGAHDELKTAPKGYPKDHPRIELLRYKGIVMSKSWPVGAWHGTKKAKERVVTCLEAARPLNACIERAVGVA